MARTYSATTNRISSTAFTPSGTAGTISCWLNPAWSSGDSGVHPFWFFGSASNECPSFQKSSDNNIYAGFNGNAFGEQRIIMSDAGLFTAGVWANWVLTWSNAAGQTLYKGAVSKGSTGAITTFTSANYTIGNYDVSVANFDARGAMADFAYWDVILSGGDLTALAAGVRPPAISPSSLKLYLPLDGFASPETDLSGNGKDGTLSGTARVGGPPLVERAFGG